MLWTEGRWTERRRPVARWLAALLLLGAAVSARTPAQAPAAPFPSLPAPPPAAPAQPHFVVVLDAAHGGADTGARIDDRLLEKDLVLALSVRLRSMLTAHGIPVITTREADANLPAVNRAELANHAVAAACISLHATATGSGIHLFTSSLAPTAPARFPPWQTAQSAYITQSLRLSSEVNSAMARAQVPVGLGRTSMQPLDSFACPALAVEAAPLAAHGANSKPMALSDPDYQARLAEALTAALQQWRENWRQQP